MKLLQRFKELSPTSFKILFYLTNGRELVNHYREKKNLFAVIINDNQGTACNIYVKLLKIMLWVQWMGGHSTLINNQIRAQNKWSC